MCAWQNIWSKRWLYPNWRLDFVLCRRTCFSERMLELHYAVRIIFASARSTITYLACGRLRENRRVPDAMWFQIINFKKTSIINTEQCSFTWRILRVIWSSCRTCKQLVKSKNITHIYRYMYVFIYLKYKSLSRVHFPHYISYCMIKIVPHVYSAHLFLYAVKCPRKHASCVHCNCRSC